MTTISERVASAPQGVIRKPDASSSDVALRVIDIQKTFSAPKGATVRALRDVSLEVSSGEFVVLLGPSGCGKTTLLRSIAGLETPTSGTIEIGSQTVFSSDHRVNISVRSRGVGMMFQSYALWPHMTVRQTVEFPLRVSGVPRRERARKAGEILDALSIGNLQDRFPYQLSGGQQQRVALARALAVNQHVILLDEPLSNVDAKIREVLRVELVRLQRELGFAAVFVTHDQSEAMELADRIVVMNGGEVQQVASPKSMYESPVNSFVAKFIGVNNEFTAGVVSVGADGTSLSGPWGSVRASKSIDTAVGDQVLVTVRPERIRLKPAILDTVEKPNQWRGQVVRTLFCGSYLEYFVTMSDGRTARVRAELSSRVREGDDVMFVVRDEDIDVFPLEVRA